MKNRDGVWTVAATGIGAVFQIAQMAIAARYLSAIEFGILAIVAVSANIVLEFQDMGLSSFCVHLGDADRRSHSTIFWTSAAFGLVSAIGMFLLSGLLSSLYKMPSAQPLFMLVALNLFLVGVSGQYQANLIRTFKARRLAQYEIVGRIVAFGATTGLLALHVLGPGAIIAGMVVFTKSKLALMSVTAPRETRPHYEFDRSLAPRALAFGANQAGSQVISQIRAQADQLIVSGIFGPRAAGTYYLAKELVSYPMRFMHPLIARLTLPSFALLQGDRGKLQAAFLLSVRRTSTLSGLTFAGVAVLLPWLVEIMYGLRFIQAVPIVIALATFGAVRPIGLSIGMLAQATGRAGHELRWTLISSSISILPLLGLMILKPAPLAFAVAASAVQVLVTVAAHPFFVRPLEPVPFRAYIQSAAPSLILAVVGVLAASVINLPSLYSIWLGVH
jgi:exopolysaccharide (amylovoran) exporter